MGWDGGGGYTKQGAKFTSKSINIYPLQRKPNKIKKKINQEEGKLGVSLRYKLLLSVRVVPDVKLDVTIKQIAS